MSDNDNSILFAKTLEKGLKKRVYYSIATILAVIVVFYVAQAQVLAEDYFVLEETTNLQIVDQNTLLPQTAPPAPQVVRRIKVMVTAYSSTIWETDDTPFITASNKKVRNGIVANNLLAFGTMVRFPEIFDDRVFHVEDRMSSQKGDYHFDIWFPEREDALDFGAKVTLMEIIRE